MCQWVQASWPQRVQPVAARQQHHRLDIAAEVRPLRRTHAAVDRQEQPDRRAEEFEIARVLPIAAGAVLARHTDRLIKRGADLAAAGFIGLFQTARVDVVFGALAARQQFRPRAHQRLELFELGPGQRIDPPRLHIAAGGRARRASRMSRTVARGPASAGTPGMSSGRQRRRRCPWQGAPQIRGECDGRPV